MRCPFCLHTATCVKDSRTAEDQTSIRRRRVCEACGSRFTTFEHVQLRDIHVVKRNGTVQLYDRAKIHYAIERAVHKRKIAAGQIEKLVTSISRQLEQMGENEIQSTEIGKLIMQSLQEIDPVAYIRFCSVYQDFNDVTDFVKIITTLNDKNEI